MSNNQLINALMCERRCECKS